jgi:RNA polymerase sigma-70 factor (family 1)
LIHDETEVIPLLKIGNEAAFLYIYEKFQSNLFQRALRLLDNQSEAEDVTAESFLKLWNAKSSFESVAAIGSWLKITTRNASLDILKHRQVRTQNHHQLLTAALSVDEWTNEDLFAEALREIYQQIELLPAKSREVFKLRYIQGLRNEEIAQQMAIHNQSVRDHLSRSLKVLRAYFLKKELIFSFLLIWLNTK